MQFALVDGQECEATPGLRGQCRGCGKIVIAKCGDWRMWHWAHLGKRTCDPWWEPETQWHRLWKENFDKGWREVFARDQNGEKHVADVRTPLGLVIEFQHSHLNQQERTAREAFYGNMVWLADGTRRKRDWPRFAEGRHTMRRTAVPNVFITPFPEENLPADWLNCSVPVFFDFAGTEAASEIEQDRRMLWCLLPGRVHGYAVIVAGSREAFVKGASSRDHVVNVAARQKAVALELEHWKRVEQQREVAVRAANRRLYSSRPKPRSSWYRPNPPAPKKPARPRRSRY